MENNYLNVLEQLEKQKYKFKCYYNTCIALLEFQSSCDKNKYKHLKGKNIYIYGCGEIGKRFYNIIKNNTNVISFIDQSAERNPYKYEEKEVISLNDVKFLKGFDYIIITLSDVYQFVYNDLKLIGIKDEQIKNIEEVVQ